MTRYEFVEAGRLKEARFEAMLWPEFREWIKVAFSEEMHLVLAEWDEEKLVGLLVADKHPHSTVATLQSLEGENKQELLLRMEDKLTELGAEMMGMEWQREETLENLLKEQGWNLGEKRFETYFFDMTAFNPTWLSSSPPLPDDFEVIPWEARTELEEEQLNYWAAQDSTLLSPAEETLPREKLNSLLLRHQGALVGWVETHRQNPQMIRYTSLFVAPPFRKQGVGISLLVDSLKRHIESVVPIAVFALNLSETTPSWKNFVRQRLAPHAYHYLETYISFKNRIML